MTPLHLKILLACFMGNHIPVTEDAKSCAKDLANVGYIQYKADESYYSITLFGKTIAKHILSQFNEVNALLKEKPPKNTADHVSNLCRGGNV